MDRQRTATGGGEPSRPGAGTGRTTRRLRIEGIQFHAEIGRGRGTVLYRAVRLTDQQVVAVKVLLPSEHAPSARLEAFLHAGRIAKALHHPHVESCMETESTANCGYQVLAHAGGGSIASLIARESACAYPVALGLAIETTRGLETLAREGLVHGAISPSNVLLSPEQQAVLAVPTGPLAQASDGAERLALHRLRQGCVPPEVLLGRSACTQRGDLYSIGAILRQLVTGEMTRPAASWEELEAILTGTTAAGAELVPGMSPGWNAVLKKCLALDESARYASATQLREDLERVLHDFSPIHARMNPSIAFGRRRSTASTDTTMTRPLVIETDIAGADQTVLVAAPAADQPPAPTPAPAATRRAPRMPWPMIAGILAPVLVGMVVLAWWLLSGPARAQAPGQTPATSATPGAAAAADQVAGSATRDSAPAMTSAPVAGHAAAPTVAPSWAGASGSDEYGRWADLVLHDATQRFRFCPPGTAWIGSADGEEHRRPDEEHLLVTLTHGFWIADSEVTQQLYQAVMGENPSAFRGPLLPVESLSFDRSQEFTRRLAGLAGAPARLPTEAEWEYACRAGQEGDYAVPPAEASWSRENSASTTHPVKLLHPNRWGLYDMEGNVLEWCLDTYGPYPHEAASDPCATGGIFQVARGGAWSLPATDSRSASRHHFEPVARLFFLGERLVIDDQAVRTPAGAAVH